MWEMVKVETAQMGTAQVGISQMGKKMAQREKFNWGRLSADGPTADGRKWVSVICFSESKLILCIFILKVKKYTTFILIRFLLKLS